jgi:hypothetical protein
MKKFVHFEAKHTRGTVFDTKLCDAPFIVIRITETDHERNGKPKRTVIADPVAWTLSMMTAKRVAAAMNFVQNAPPLGTAKRVPLAEPDLAQDDGTAALQRTLDELTPRNTTPENWNEIIT